MKKALFTLATVATLGFIASTASAQCDFNEPFKAKGLKSDMIKAMTPCGGTAGQTINTASATGIPACTPPLPLSSYNFGVKGKCSVKTTHKYEAPCKWDGSSECSDITLKLKCSDVLDPSDTPAFGSGWSLSTLARATFNDSDGGGDDMTIVDFPAQFPIPDASKGKIKAKLSTNELLDATGGTLPGCSAVELLNMYLLDPNGDIFASMGSQARP